MEIQNGKIVKCTDTELFQYWLLAMSDIMDYENYKRACIERGTEVVEDDT